MKEKTAAVMTLLIVLLPANAQPGQTPTATQVQSAKVQQGRSSYDPMSAGKGNGLPKGIVGTTLAGVNPENKDYGVVVGGWRKEVFETAITRAYLWMIFLLCVSLSTSLVGNVWLIRENRRRLTITASIVVQIFNAYVVSRAKSLEVITKYNFLVDRFNRQHAERTLALPPKVSEPDAKEGSLVDFDRVRQDRAPQLGTTGETPVSATVDELAGGPDLEVDKLRRQLRDIGAAVQRKDAQLQAKDNQITNLRGRLARAHDSLEGERQVKTGARSGA